MTRQLAMDSWFDSHCHLQDPRLGDAADEIGKAAAAGVTRWVVNATREDDWQAVATLAADFPNRVIPAFGIHPWHAATAAPGWELRLEEWLEKHPRAGIGECGLDRWVSEPGIDLQLPVFLTQLRIARRTRRPLSIHCLKAWGILLEALSKEPPPAGFLMHSYGGSLENARQLLPLGARFSFSGHFLHERKAGVREVFQQLPKERILVETDAPDMPPPDAYLAESARGGPNRPANLPIIGRGLAEVLGMEAADLAALTHANAAGLFVD
jgi:TatD DNase family protein